MNSNPKTAFRAGLVQMCSGRDVKANLADADKLIRAAAKDGAQYILTPENTMLMELDPLRLELALEPEEGNTALAYCQALAQELAIYLHIGSIGVRLANKRIANRSYLIGPSGKIETRYDKIHLFDVDLPNNESYRESESYQAGSQAVIADLPWARLGFSTCYDLRFPGLYRVLAHGGAEVIAVPSAFTEQTGRAHWHILARSRAIENGCFILAAAQGGRHENGRSTYGHSLVVSPWGEIVAALGTEPGHLVVEINLGEVAEVRRRIPSLTHDRPFEVAAQPQREAS